MADKKSKFLNWDKLAMWIIGGLVLFLIGFSYFWSNLTLAGEEFSPELFQVRAFSYWRLPGTKMRLSATKIGVSSSPCTKHILNHLKPISTGVTWQVITASQGNAKDQLAPGILTKYLYQKNPNGDSYWDDWSFHHPKQAAILWPVVQQAAMRELYVCVPDLFRTAEAGGEEGIADNPLNVALKRICLRAASMKQHTFGASSDATTSSSALSQWARDFAGDVLEDPDIQDAISTMN
jgi:hypothetical protein